LRVIGSQAAARRRAARRQEQFSITELIVLIVSGQRLDLLPLPPYSGLPEFGAL
jgi:hypothetical protein